MTKKRRYYVADVEVWKDDKRYPSLEVEFAPPEYIHNLEANGYKFIKNFKTKVPPSRGTKIQKSHADIKHRVLVKTDLINPARWE